MRVAQVITGLPLGGCGQVMLGIARNIDRSRFHLDFFCVIEGGEYAQEIEKLGFTVTVLPSYDYRRLLRYNLSGVVGLARRLRAGRYDIVHTHLFQADVVGRLAAPTGGKCHIVKTLHNMGTWKRRYHLLVDKFLDRRTDRVICVSEHQRQAVIRQEGLDPAKVVTIRNGVDIARFRTSADRPKLLQSLGLDPGRPLVGTVGRWIEEKGQIHLLHAVPLILEKFPDAQFLLVGDGRLRGKIESFLAGKPWRSRVSLPGLRADIPELLSVMDVFVFPSVMEGYGIALAESMAAGCPVACSAIPPLTEIVTDDDSGLLFRPADPASLAAAVCRLLGDAALRERLRRRGREVVLAGHSEVAAIRALERLYIELSSGAPEGGP